VDPKLNKPLFIDSHCHLPLLKESVGSILEKCNIVGVERILNVGYDQTSSEESLALTKHGIISASVGIHPHYVGGNLPMDIVWLINMIKNPSVVAIGEIGLDTVKSSTSRDLQIEWLEAQLSIADEYHLPVVIHNRSADQDIEAIIKKYTGVKGVLHCYSSGIEFGFRMLDIGWYLSFSGNITYAKSDILRQLVKDIPLNRMLLETDAPYLTPMPFRGKQENSPLMMPGIYEFVASIRGEDLMEMSHQIASNFELLFLQNKRQDL
jgi:TatD DNase family protein